MRKILALFIFFLCGHFALAQDSTLHEYKGVYKFKEGSPTPSVEITLLDGALYATSSLGSGTLNRIAKDTFSIPEHSGVAFFYRNEEGRVKSIRIEVADLILEGDKEPTSLAVINRKRTHSTGK